MAHASLRTPQGDGGSNPSPFRHTMKLTTAPATPTPARSRAPGRMHLRRRAGPLGDHYSAATIRRTSRIAAAASLRCPIAAAENAPCFQFARLLRSSPSAVRGPVLAPPCIRHRPLAIAGARQGSPVLPLAAHRGAAFALSEREDADGAWGPLLIFALTPSVYSPAYPHPRLCSPCQLRLPVHRGLHARAAP